MTTAPHSNDVDVIIAVHDPSRPLQRAVDSVLQQTGAGVTVSATVVCHNLDPATMRRTLHPATAAAVRWLELHDGVRSAAGPFNHGIALSQAEFISVLGSDDYLESGAIGGWIERVNRNGLDAVIAPERHAGGRPVRTPPVRPQRARVLDGVRDRLAYRTAPLGLVRRATVEQLGLRFTPGLATGDDQEFTARLWFSEARVGYGHGTPRYVVGDDARSRITLTDRPLRDELRFVQQLIEGDWFPRQPVSVRGALAIKMTRVHLFSAASRRVASGSWTPDDRAFVVRLLAALRAAAPGFERPFAVADRRMIRAIEFGSTREIGERSVLRRRFGRPSTLITRDLRGLFAIEGPIRFSLASALL